MKTAIKYETDGKKEWKVPVFIINIDKNSLFPVKYRYKGRGYTDLIFNGRLSEFDFNRGN